MILNFINWAPDPVIFDLGFLAPRWYGLLFAGSFFIALYILNWVYKIEGRSERELDRLAISIIGAVVLGARLGHCIFYQPEQYFAVWNGWRIVPTLEILKVWEGGLASHGAAFAIILTVWILARITPNTTFLWIADRLSIVIAICAVFVRLGNLMNSEICGLPTRAPWAFTFKAEHLHPGSDCFCDGQNIVARHPTQLYEATAYLLLFGLLLFLYNRLRRRTPQGLLTGIMLATLFTARFLIEFVKMPQEDYQHNMPINTGQMLSLPLIAFGLGILFYALKNKDKNMPPAAAEPAPRLPEGESNV